MQSGRRNYCQIAMDGSYALLDTVRPIPKEGEILKNVIADSLQPVGPLRFLRIADHSDIKFLQRHQDVLISGSQVPFYSVLVLGKTVNSENSDEQEHSVDPLMNRKQSSPRLSNADQI